MEERRLLLAVALSLLVLTAYSLLFAPTPPPPTPAVGPSPAAAAAAPAVTPPAAARAATPEAPALVPAVADERERRVEVVGPEYSVAFTNRGARLVSWTLARYRDARGRPEEMVPAQGAGVRPLDVETGDPALDARLRDALFQPSTESLTVSGKEPRTLRFTFSDGEVAAEKTLSFRESGLVDVIVSVTRNGQPVAAARCCGVLASATRPRKSARSRATRPPAASRSAPPASSSFRRPSSPRPADRSPACAGSASRATTSRRCSWRPGAPARARSGPQQWPPGRRRRP